MPLLHFVILRINLDILQQALGAWLYGMLEKSNPTGNGLSATEMRKQGDQYLIDGRILGQFSIDVADPEFAANCFISRAEG